MQRRSPRGFPRASQEGPAPVSISSSMNASVAGLAAQANHLGTISDNIANSATPGYKRATTEFAAMVIDGGGSYVAGGVRGTSLRLIEERGSLTTTTNATDIAIAGRGMLPVTSATAVANGVATADLPFMLTSTGTFTPDPNGYLRTPSGLMLMGVPVGTDNRPPDFPRTTTTSLEPVQIRQNHIAGTPTTKMDIAANLPADGTAETSTGAPEALTVEYFDNIGLPQTLSFSFTPTVAAAGSPPTNAWSMEITDDATGTVVGEYDVVFDATRAAGGFLDSVALAAGGAGGAYDPADGSVSVNVLAGPIDIQIGRLNLPGGFTQLGSTFAPITTEKDGAPAGTLAGVEVDPAGYIVATYDSGETRRLYQIPVVDVPNRNGLLELDSQTFAVSRESGAFMLWDAGTGPVGDMVGFAREESATDVAHELTQLIKTQRAYSSNAKVIQTVDEMFQETTNIKR